MIETYSYAGDGMRRQKLTGSGTTNYLWDGQNVLAELDQNQVTQAQYTHSPGVWGGLMSQRRSGVSSFYSFDLAGNTRALTSPAAAITDSYSYKAFGPELATSGSTTNPHRYCGVLGYYRDNASRHYVRARHLRADSGRWMSLDPRGFDAEDPNLYRYVYNQPLASGDPTGQQISDTTTFTGDVHPLVRRAFECYRIPPAGPSPRPPKLGPYKPTWPIELGYGNYCGGSRAPLRIPAVGSGRVKPPKWIDELDKCCKPHDMAYKQFNCTPVIDKRPQCINADHRLCKCAGKAKCANDENLNYCQNIQTDIQILFCLRSVAKAIERGFKDLLHLLMSPSK